MRLILFSLLVLLAIKYVIGSIIYVNGNISIAFENQSGDLWSSAFSKIYQALAIAKNNDEIWIAKGIYYPTQEFRYCLI